MRPGEAGFVPLVVGLFTGGLKRNPAGPGNGRPCDKVPAESADNHGESCAGAPESVPMDTATVLFVDDEESILRSLQRTLRKEPYRVLTAGSGEQGLAILRANPVQLVVSDQRMPEMTGTQFLQQVQELSPQSVRVILSGYAEAHIIVEAINNGGIYRFIAKPWNDEELKTTLRQCLEHFRIREENLRLSELSARQVRDLERLNQRLESAVDERTQFLALAQDVLETLPSMVLGVSRERELVLSNGAARRGLPSLAEVLPGADITEVLPRGCVEVVDRCLAGGGDATCDVEWGGRKVRVQVALLGPVGEPRGCVLLLEAAPS